MANPRPKTSVRQSNNYLSSEFAPITTFLIPNLLDLQNYTKTEAEEYVNKYQNFEIEINNLKPKIDQIKTHLLDASRKQINSDFYLLNEKINNLVFPKKHILQNPKTYLANCEELNERIRELKITTNQILSKYNNELYIDKKQCTIY